MFFLPVEPATPRAAPPPTQRRGAFENKGMSANERSPWVSLRVGLPPGTDRAAPIGNVAPPLFSKAPSHSRERPAPNITGILRGAGRIDKERGMTNTPDMKIVTIKIGAYASVQGPVEETLPCGQVRIRVGGQVYTGKPVKGKG